MAKTVFVVVLVAGKGSSSFLAPREDVSVPFARRKSAERRMAAIANWAVASAGDYLIIEARTV